MLISLWRRVREARRLPLLPLVMLLVVLVIPAVFAPLIAPHSPIEGNLNDRLLPPFWVGETVEVYPGPTLLVEPRCLPVPHPPWA